MPSKLLIAPAEAAHAVERFAAFGLAIDGPVKIDGRAVMARVKRERDRFVGFVLDGVDAHSRAQTGSSAAPASSTRTRCGSTTG